MTNQNNQSVWMQTLGTAYPKFQSINPDKAKTELGFAMQIFQGNAELQKCEPTSILNAVVNVARTSITLNPVMRLAYLVPRKSKCVLEFSYMGLVALLRDNGCIKSISAHIVFEDEEFDYDLALNKITHKPRFAKTEMEHNSREKIGCYSRATLPNGEVVYEFMPMWEIMKVKRMSVGSNSQYSAWTTWEDEMIKKSVIKRHFKMLISGNPSEALATAMQIENENNQLQQSFEQKQTTAKKSIMNAFSDVEEESNQLTIESVVEEPKVTETNVVFDLTDEQIEQELQAMTIQSHSNATNDSEKNDNWFGNENDLFHSNE
jgi:recombination protein RecT